LLTFLFSFQRSFLASFNLSVATLIHNITHSQSLSITFLFFFIFFDNVFWERLKKPIFVGLFTHSLYSDKTILWHLFQIIC